MVKKHLSNKEEQILSLVREHPQYSINKLNEVLDHVSRHSIQRTLEKHRLSTLEKRLAYVKRKRRTALVADLNLAKKLIKVGQKLPKIGEGVSFKDQRLPSLRLVVRGAMLLILGIAGWRGASYFWGMPPEISLKRPAEGSISQGEKLFISGLVKPRSARVMVNQELVAINGDGGFTAVINIPEGETVLKVSAKRGRRQAEVLRLVSRELTEEERGEKLAKAEKKRQKALDKEAEMDRMVNDLYAAKNASQDQKFLLKIINNHLEEEEGFSRVVGEVVNLGDQEVSWVMVTVRFLGSQNEVLDTKYGFATDFEELLKPGEMAKFETQSTTIDFDRYDLALSWERGRVAGLATRLEEEATESADLVERDVF